MDELLTRATAGVDMDAPGAIWQIYANLFALIPWVALFWWSVLFIVVGGLLGLWRGGWRRGVIWAAVLGPIGWVVVVCKPRDARHLPPPLPPSRSRASDKDRSRRGV